jgi:ketopantoate reductase
MYEKLIWISTYMLVGAVNNCSSVGDASKNYSKQIESIINELVTGVSEKEGITFTQGTIDRLKSYTDVVADFPCGVKEFEWRNKYFYDLGDDNVPIHNNLLKECSKKGILSFDLP